jgi:hypothetical protein
MDTKMDTAKWIAEIIEMKQDIALLKLAAGFEGLREDEDPIYYCPSCEERMSLVRPGKAAYRPDGWVMACDCGVSGPVRELKIEAIQAWGTMTRPVK